MCEIVFKKPKFPEFKCIAFKYIRSAHFFKTPIIYLTICVLTNISDKARGEIGWL